MFSSTVFAFPVSWIFHSTSVGLFRVEAFFVSMFVFQKKSETVMAVFNSQKIGQGNGRASDSGKAPSAARSPRILGSCHSLQAAWRARESTKFQFRGREANHPKSHGLSEELSPR